MKILLLNQVFYPDRVATAQHLLDLSLYLKSLGCEVTVICGQRDYENRDRRYSKFENVRGIQVHRVSSTGFGKKSILGRISDSLSFDLALLGRLALMPKQDVVIAFTSPPLIGFLGTLFCLLKRGRLVQWLMDINPHTAIEVGYLKRRSFAAKALLAVFRFTIRRSSKLIVLDRWMRTRVLNSGADIEQIVILPPWSVVSQKKERSYPNKATNPFAIEHGLVGKFVILYSGNHSVVHPLDTVLQAAEALKDDPKFKFVFIGGGLRVKDVSDFVSEHGLKNVLQLPAQPRDRLDQTLAIADLNLVVMGEKVSGLVHTSKVYSILDSGKPYVFVGPRKSHVVDLIQTSQNGYHVETGEVQELVKLARTVANLSQSKLSEIAKANKKFVRENYSPDLLLNRFAVEVLNIKPESNSPLSGLEVQPA